jgi:antitoxin ParD1/3/4
MNAAKLSVSLDPRKLEFISKYQQTHGVRTKSEVVERAIKLLEHQELKTQYAQAYSEWAASGEETVWDVTSADGLEAEDWGEFKPSKRK